MPTENILKINLWQNIFKSILRSSKIVNIVIKIKIISQPLFYIYWFLCFFQFNQLSRNNLDTPFQICLHIKMICWSIFSFTDEQIIFVVAIMANCQYFWLKVGLDRIKIFSGKPICSRSYLIRNSFSFTNILSCLTLRFYLTLYANHIIL